MDEITVVVDISKNRLDVHRWPDGAVREFTNNGAGHRALIRWLDGLPIARIVFKRALERASECGSWPGGARRRAARAATKSVTADA